MSLFCAAALFAACSSTDELEPVVQAGQQTESEAVGFDVYTRGTTRAGYVGDIDATTFQATGFGVYAYVTSAASAEEAKWTTTGTSAKPNFMANQYVTYNTSGWTYSPVKYWPNQANIQDSGVDDLGGGTADNAGDNIDYVSFFAYAPYVESGNVPYYGKESATGSVERAATAALTGESETKNLNPAFAYDGIISLPGADETGDPKITYVVPANPAYGVDLMYGVAARAYTTKETTGQIGQAVDAGKPFLDMTKEVVDDKIAYRFQHALTKLGINVDAYFDEVSGAHTNDVDANTRIVIEEISIQGTQKLYSYGVLNLNNTTENTPKWETQNAEVKDLTSRITNGLKLVDITTTGAASLDAATKEQGAKYFALQPLGVTKTKKSLFGNDISGNGNATMMLIPGSSNATASEVSVTIKYHVITRDANLQNGVSDITNTITKSLGDIALKAGSQTIINMHLGMTTVKIDAQVADWDGANTQEVDLPANVAVESVDEGSSTILGTGKITLTGAVATLSGTGGTVDLTAADVYFSTDDKGANVLPVVQTSGDYYIPANYGAEARNIYMLYGGKATAAISQPALTASNLTVTVTAVADDIAAAGENVTVKMTSVLGGFDCADWTVNQKIESGEYEEVTPTSTSNSDQTFVIAIPANAGGSRSFTFKLTHKTNTSLTKESGAKTQAAGT